MLKSCMLYNIFWSGRQTRVYLSKVYIIRGFFFFYNIFVLGEINFWLMQRGLNWVSITIFSWEQWVISEGLPQAVVCCSGELINQTNVVCCTVTCIGQESNIAEKRRLQASEISQIYIRNLHANIKKYVKCVKEKGHKKNKKPYLLDADLFAPVVYFFLSRKDFGMSLTEQVTAFFGCCCICVLNKSLFKHWAVIQGGTESNHCKYGVMADI